jgi:hypothetical protein
MKINWTKAFIYSAGGILLGAGLIRWLIAAGHQPVLGMADPLLGIPVRDGLLIVGAVELGVAGLCLFGKNLRLQTALLAWLGTNLVVYQVGLVWLHLHPQAGCLGSLTDPLQLARGTLGYVTALMPGFVVLGSYATVATELLPKRTKRTKAASRDLIGVTGTTPATETRQAAYVRFVKIACGACGGRIEFPANAFGENIPCPHCQAAIILQKPVAVKMSCPACAGHLEFPDYALGQKIPCPHCQVDIVLTAQSSEPRT